MAIRNSISEKVDNSLSNATTTNVRSSITTYENEGYKAVETLVNGIRNVTDSVIDVLQDIAIGDMCDNMMMNYQFMRRLMYVNDNEARITLNALGTNANLYGDSSQISNLLQAPTFAEARNYVENYQKNIVKNENQGIDSTRKMTDARSNVNIFNYRNGNQLYKATQNLFPDEESKGLSTAWQLSSSLDSTLRKTKDLFNRKKINTIISAFHTRTEAPESPGDVRTRYGISHGRNLLTKKAEISNGGTYPINGYDNPYCRVWTHHYQYNRIDRLIRPFCVATDDARENTHAITLQDFHKWPNFKVDDADWGWKSEKNTKWAYSVLGDNGYVNIAPKYDGGGAKNIHPKQCMFSIENLAWQGFDPYSFEQALSWEQRGPMGGRIMWFPPYGLEFSEATTADWTQHKFIGRGEPVFTYSNTIRRGTLNFMLVVDHPSIIDYVTWDDKDHSKANDTDILRFFAGCEGEASTKGDTVTEMDGYGSTNDQTTASLRDRANPTPLTDEYIYQPEDEEIPADPQEDEPEDVADELNFVFFVFYPNNYAGYYDTKDYTEVEPIAYLLNGICAQKQYDENNPQHPMDLPITFDNLSIGGYGYEMLTPASNGVSTGNKTLWPYNYIQGTSTIWEQVKNNSYTDGTEDYQKWWYRIDGKYQYASNTTEQNTNTYDQQLQYKNNNNNIDSETNGLNCDVQSVKNNMGNLIDANETLVSFAEVAYVLGNEQAKTVIEYNSSDKVNESNANVQTLTKIFYPTDSDNEYILSAINIVGYANSHGREVTSTNSSKTQSATEQKNNARNTILGKHRAETIEKWLNEVVTNNTNIDITSTSEDISNKITDVSTKFTVDINAKKYRSAKVTIVCKKNVTTIVAESDQTDIVAGTSYRDEASLVASMGLNPSRMVNNIQYYYNPNETNDEKKYQEWYYDKDSQQMVLVTNKEIMDRSNYGKFRANKGMEINGGNGVTATDGSNDYNRLRYDQEYHFFKKLKEKSPIVFESLTEKLKYFDPAFHSMTPEGFNGRLTFLNQMFRQGPTVGASDRNSASANNLAFGRPPVCILRIGDFFNTKIIPENLSINYDPLWDLNTEGVGVQPMIARVSISFTFIGGMDLEGAIARLQNAASFNYYANTELYDNRADRFSFEYSQMTNGALDHDVKPKSTTIYNPKMQS